MANRRDRVSDAPLFAWGDALRAARLRRRCLARRIAFLGAGVALVAATIIVPPAPRLVWNASSSAPVGLYSVSPGGAIEPGDMVIARVPEPYRLLAATRHYLPINVPLVKRVGGMAGDEICARGRQIVINGHWAASRQIVDGSGRPMPAWSGCVRLHPGQLFLLIADNLDSFDGRYFGMTAAGDVVGKARLLWPR